MHLPLDGSTYSVKMDGMLTKKRNVSVGSGMNKTKAYGATNGTAGNRDFDDTVGGQEIHRAGGEQVRGRRAVEDLQEDGEGGRRECRAVHRELQGGEVEVKGEVEVDVRRAGGGDARCRGAAEGVQVGLQQEVGGGGVGRGVRDGRAEIA